MEPHHKEQQRDSIVQLAQYKPNILQTRITTHRSPKSGSFLNMCIADNRIHFHDLTTHNKLKSYKYDSDHRTISVKISLNTHEHFEIDKINNNIKYNYNKADWPKFRAHLNSNNNIDIPKDRNRITDEIDKYIEQLDTNITNAIDHAVEHANNNYNSTDRYITPRIKKLRKQKHQLIIKINKLTRLDKYSPDNDLLIAILKYTLKAIRHEIKKAFQNSVSQYWKHKISNVTLQKQKDLLLSINSIFRTPTQNNIDTLEKPKSHTHLITEANLERDKLQTDRQKFNYLRNTRQTKHIRSSL
ncbi:hypothetical protein WN51_04178 [Melipona quadrifasciata]|uniref:Uncharacterized protein n=1 Tax=Melipona quadrifasciata TaxID=166423 RepID=A0A0N0BCA2_9HYME|nr:hypothetical protein WN51_04178 [Melipona quadrifasciata]